MYSFQLAKRIVGIDWGTHSLKIAECQRAKGRITLLNYEILHLPAGRGAEGRLSLEEETAFLKETLDKMGVKTGRVVSEVGGPWTVARHLILPDLPDEEMREAIRWGSKADFPFALDDALIDFLRLDVSTKEDGAKEAEIVAAAAGRGVVERRLELLKESGLKALFISLPAFSLMQAYRFTQPPPWRETVVILDLGGKNTHIVILKEGKLKFFREIAVSGDFFTQALTGTCEIQGAGLEIDPEKAEKIKCQADLAPSGESGQVLVGIPVDWIQKRLTAVADRLVLEVERSLNYYKNQFKDYEIARVLLTGGGSLLKGLGPYLERNLDIPVRSFEGVGTLRLKKKLNEELFQKHLPFLTTLLGLISQERPLVDLGARLPSPRARILSRERMLKPTLAALIPLGVIFFFASQYLSASREVARLQKDLASKKEQLARFGKPAEEMQRLEQREAALDRTLQTYPKIKIGHPPLKDFLEDLPDLLPPNMMLTRLQIRQVKETLPPVPSEVEHPQGDQGGPPVLPAASPVSETALEIQGTAFGSDAEVLFSLSAFVRNLKGTRWVKEAKLQGTKKHNEYAKTATDFVIRGKLRQEAPGERPPEEGSRR